MAAGRGEFFQSLMYGLERRPVQPVPGRSLSVPGRVQAGPWNAPFRGKNWKKRPEAAAPSPVSGTLHSWAEQKTDKNWEYFDTVKSSSSEQNFMERYLSEPGPIQSDPSDPDRFDQTSNLFFRLPSEILVKILLYLDASSLFCITHVSKLFHQLASDNVMWHKIYMSDFGGPTWKPKSADDAVAKEELAAVHPTGHWKKMYFRTIAGQELSKWRRTLRDISPSTGLPGQTKWILRNMNVSWELTVCDCLGQKVTLEPSRAYFFESSVMVRWSGDHFPRYHRISSIQLHGVRKDAAKTSKPGWRSLIWKMDMTTHSAHFIGKDRLIKLMLLSPGFIIGIWRGQSNVAFVMVSLHFHKLVEKSLLGSPVCPYSEPMDPPHVDRLDPEFGLYGYTLHFVLHNTSTEIMSGHYRQLSRSTVQMQRGLVELKVINSTSLSQHRSLSGNIKLPWQSDVLEGSVENCCIMTLTLLDEFQKPFWCVSAPVCIAMANRQLSRYYTGEHFLMEYKSPDGEVKMKLVWLKEPKQFFLISLTIYISVLNVNKHFSTEYCS